MKCSKCGAELKVGCIYCSVCGQEAQIVPDYNILEDDLLRELLKEDEPEKNKSKAHEKRKKANKSKANKNKANKNIENKKKKSKKPLIISCIVIVTAVLAVALTVFLVRQKRENSYDYQYGMGEKSLKEKDYTKALKYFDRALELDDTSIDTRMQLVRVEQAVEDADAAITMLHEIIDMDSSNAEAYGQLIALYLEKKDIKAILKLKEQADGDEILKLFQDFETNAPEFTLDPGTYPEFITIEMTADADSSIYYTLDGTDPTENGTRYTTGIKLEQQGEISIRAAARNELGIYSPEIAGKFIVKFQKPDTPEVIPDGGSFQEPVPVTITVPEGARVFYTWDDSIPDGNSAEYTGQIEMPMGNNILSVILLDKYGMFSDVLKCNFHYLP